MIDKLERALKGGMATAREITDAKYALARRAELEKLIDVAYSEVDSPLGPLMAAATPKGLALLHYGEDDEALQQLADKISPRVLHAPARLDEVRKELDEYFDGKRKRFDFRIDWRLMAPFQQKVLKATYRIPFGKVATYRDVATKAGAPKGSRAAGNALGANPIPIVVPCHRVVRTGGGLGGYTGGLHRKEFLLELEGVTLGPR
ncbi:MAG TPA: methylated-DNA--[protein]-cysteine S-methyltransferase [Actinomycetota bacterium]|nr:methylated-DNA--[protein]-cysteine S-methyltransferase [Actinomycetota bacterium]